MSSKKLGALLRSVPPATARDEPGPSKERQVSETQPLAPPEPAPEPVHRKAVRSTSALEPEVPLQVLVPKNIRKELAMKAAEEGESLRALMLRAIRSLGVKVTDAEIAGKRGQRKP
jgi:hypothetical protein